MAGLYSKSYGFTAIELMGAVALACIVVTIGFSAFETYVARAEIAKSILAAGDVQEHVVAAFKARGEPPVDGNEARVQSSAIATPFVATTTVVDGRIDMRFATAAHPALAGRTLSLIPFETAALRVVWICGNRLPPPGLKPLGFASGGRQSTQVITDIEPRYLPPTCR